MFCWRIRGRERETPIASWDSWFYWSQGSHKHFLYLCRYKKLESTWQLRGYRIVLRVIQSNFWIHSGHKKCSRPCAYNVLISWIYKRTGSRSSKSQTEETVHSGRRQFSPEIWSTKVATTFHHVFFFFQILGLVFTRSKCKLWNRAAWQHVISLS